MTAQGLAFFGMPFPQRKYDQVFMPEFGGAMENYGCVTWSDTSLRRAALTPAEREVLATVLLHEMAHMWFGKHRDHALVGRPLAERGVCRAASAVLTATPVRIRDRCASGKMPDAAARVILGR